MGASALTRETVFAYAKEQFGTEPEHLWANDPGAAVLRHAGSRKWYALVMEVRRERLGLPGVGCVWVMDVKCDPALVGALRTRAGFLPAYHMNKDRWVSLLLDGAVSCAEGLQLLDMSYALAAPKLKKASRKANTDKQATEGTGNEKSNCDR